MVIVKGRLINPERRRHTIVASLDTEYNYYNHPLKDYGCSDRCFRVAIHKSIITDFIDEFADKIVDAHIRITNIKGRNCYIVSKMDLHK